MADVVLSRQDVLQGEPDKEILISIVIQISMICKYLVTSGRVLIAISCNEL